MSKKYHLHYPDFKILPVGQAVHWVANAPEQVKQL